VQGGATVAFNGIKFDGDNQYATVAFGAATSYERGALGARGEFSVSFWMTKEQCTGGIYEYMYSHVSTTSQASVGPSMWTTSGLNIYLGCDTRGMPRRPMAR
jgi:hypothetical protein